MLIGGKYKFLNKFTSILQYSDYFLWNSIVLLSRNDNLLHFKTILKMFTRIFLNLSLVHNLFINVSLNCLEYQKNSFLMFILYFIIFIS